MYQPVHLPIRQRGAATLLIVLMLGLAVSVSVAATVYSLRGTQSSQLTGHANTAAQAAAWRGVETLRRFVGKLDDAQLVQLTGKKVTGMESLGVQRAVIGTVVAGAPTGSPSRTPYQVSASVTGRAGGTRARAQALATATVQVVYAVVPRKGVPGTPPMCHSRPSAPMVFNGDLTASGGSIHATDPDGSWNYRDIVVTGDLTLKGGTSATLSGCIKGNVSIAGGGVTDHGHIYSEKDISISGMGSPTDASFWGRNITIPGSTAQGSFRAIKAGAFQANVMNGSLIVGTAFVPGRLLPDPNDPAIPRTTGTVVPPTSGRVVITLNDGTRYLLDLRRAEVDASTGQVLVGAAAELLDEDAAAGHDTLPASLGFAATGIYGGDLTYRSTTPVDTMWGHAVALNDTNQGEATVQTLLANGNLHIGFPTIGSLLKGGGNLYAVLSSMRYPTFQGSAAIVGDAYRGSNDKLDADDVLAHMPPLAVGQPDASPGLPGVPWCEARISQIDVNNFKADANYVYELVAGKPRLTIQNVRTDTGADPINGVYDLTALKALMEEMHINPNGGLGVLPAKCDSLNGADKRAQCLQLSTLVHLMACHDGNDAGCLEMWQAGAGRWDMQGAAAIPPGVFWFDDDLFMGGGNTFNNTLVVAGNIELYDAGTNELVAPNRADVADVCGATWYPGNLCADTSHFKTWCDVGVPTGEQCPAANQHVGIPLGNMAVISAGGIGTESQNTGAQLAGWDITGNVVLGRALKTSGGTITINGTLSVGMNHKSDTNVSAGGLVVNVPSNGDDANTMPFCTGGSSAVYAPGQANVLWSRYR